MNYCLKKNIQEARRNNGYLGGLKKTKDGKHEIVRMDTSKLPKCPMQLITVTQPDGTQMLVTEGLRKYDKKHSTEKIYEYEVFTIDSHLHMSKDVKDYYHVNKYNIYSEMDSENLKSVPYFPNLNQIQKTPGGYIGKYIGNKQFKTDDRVEDFFSDIHIDLSEDVFTKPTVQQKLNYQQQHQSPYADVASNNDLGISRDTIKEAVLKAGIRSQEINKLTNKIRNKSKNIENEQIK